MSSFSTEYFSEEGQTFEPRLIGKIKQQLSTDPTLRPEYPSSLGLTEFTRRATEAALGRGSKAVVENRVHISDCSFCVLYIYTSVCSATTHKDETAACSGPCTQSVPSLPGDCLL